MFWLMLLFVFLGIVSDVLSGAWTRSIISRKGWSAAGCSFILDVLSYSVFAWVLIDKNIILALAWFIGRAAGSYIAATLNIKSAPNSTN